MVEWITIKRFAELTGYTDQAVRDKIRGGVWLEGTVWKRAPDNRILINTRRFDAWVEGKEAACESAAPAA